MCWVLLVRGLGTIGFRWCGLDSVGLGFVDVFWIQLGKDVFLVNV